VRSSTVGVMPSVRVSEHSELPPDVVLVAARDFSDRRAEMWPDVHVEYLQVHETGENYAEVTEGNPWPIGYVWERLRYDWSDPHALRGRVIDSNLFKPGSTWELWATPEDGGSRVEIRAIASPPWSWVAARSFLSPDPTGFRSRNNSRALAPLSRQRRSV